jgi:hypothetical protein
VIVVFGLHVNLFFSPVSDRTKNTPSASLTASNPANVRVAEAKTELLPAVSPLLAGPAAVIPVISIATAIINIENGR